MGRLQILPLLTIFFIILLQNLSSAECADKSKNCQRAAAYCRWPSLLQTLKQNCELTCQYCTEPKNENNKPNNKPRNKPTKKKQPKKEKLSKYKLHYFNIRLRAEPIRLALHYKNVTFEDFRIDFADWPTLKKNYPNEQVPVLEIDGNFLSQTNAINHYVGNRFGMFGKDYVETAFLDSTAELHNDIFKEVLPFIQVKLGRSTQDADTLLNTRITPAVEKIAPQLEKLLEKSSSGFFGSKLSWVDFYVTETVTTLKGYAPTLMNKFTKLLDHNKRIYALPQLKKYLSSRPDTLM